jgi:hypothetical protein
LKALGEGIDYVDLLLIHCILKIERLIVGPIAFKAAEDGVSVANGSDDKVHPSSFLLTVSLSSMRNEQMTIRRPGKIWKHF